MCILNEVWHRIIIFVISMIPVLELRASIPLGFGFGMPLWETLLLSVTGNIIIIPAVILLFTRVLGILRKLSITGRFADWLETRVTKKSQKVQNWIFLGLMFFVAIPLPGTGAWTASMIAGLLNLGLRKSFLPIAIGVVIACVIVTLVTYGVIHIVT